MEYISIKPEELQLKKTVLLAYTDVAAAGSRALLGIDMRVECFEMHIPELDGFRPACEHATLKPTEQAFHPLQVLNCKYEEFSVVVVNTLVPGSKCHYVANKIMDLCIQSNTQKIVLLSALYLDILKEQEMYENCFFTSPVTCHKPLPADIRVSDPFLSTLLQMIRIEQLATNCLIAPGHRAKLGGANQSDGSEQTIQLFQETLQQLFSLKFSFDRSLSLMYRGKNEDNVDMVSLIYS